MAHTNDKTNDEKLLEALLNEFGESGNYIVNEDGTYTIIPNGTHIKYPSLPKKNKQGETLVTFQPKEKFVKLYKKSISYLRDNYSYKEFTVFVSLAEYARMNDCVLVNDSGAYLSAKDLSELLKIDYSNIRKVVSKFEKDGLIKHIEVSSQKDVYKNVSAIAVNPYLCMNGEHVVQNIIQQFNDVTLP